MFWDGLAWHPVNVSETERWVVVKEVFCADGNSDAAVRAFRNDHPEYMAEPDRLRIDTLCHRDSGASTVRFSWNDNPTERPPRKKPRRP